MTTFVNSQRRRNSWSWMRENRHGCKIFNRHQNRGQFENVQIAKSKLWPRSQHGGKFKLWKFVKFDCHVILQSHRKPNPLWLTNCKPRKSARKFVTRKSKSTSSSAKSWLKLNRRKLCVKIASWRRRWSCQRRQKVIVFRPLLKVNERKLWKLRVPKRKE